MKTTILTMLTLAIGITCCMAKPAITNPRGFWIVEGDARPATAHTVKFCSRGKHPLKTNAGIKVKKARSIK